MFIIVMCNRNDSRIDLMFMLWNFQGADGLNKYLAVMGKSVRAAERDYMFT